MSPEARFRFAASCGLGIELERVTAGWGAAPAFHHLDLDLPPGTRVAVVGPSGSGKSTLAAVLMRFLDPVAGEVRIAGRPTTSLMLDDVRRCVGLVDDDPHVFASTVFENVRLARPDATPTEVDAFLKDSSSNAFEKVIDRLLAHVRDPRRALAFARSSLLNEEAASLDDLADQLQVSKASISSNARLLENWGIAERITLPGDRRDFYQLSPNAEERSLQRTLERGWRACVQAASAEPAMEGADLVDFQYSIAG